MNNKIGRIMALILVALVLSACSFIGVLERLADQRVRATAQPTPTYSLPTAQPTGDIILPEYVDSETLLETLYDLVSPGVVSIQVLGTQHSNQGTGFVYDHLGHIVTNYHVVENQGSIEVHFQSGIKSYAEVVGTDIDSDLAVLKVDVDPVELVPLSFGDSDLVKVGQTVVAIGNPYGLSGTMTVGVVSARGRILDSMRSSTGGGFFSSGDSIQTDALINPGNSGGPLLNLQCQVVGVNRAIKASGITPSGDAINTGIGFAISSNVARKVVPSLIEKGSFDYPYLGITSLSNISLALQEALEMPQSIGVYITEVTAGGPAEKAGLRGGTRPSPVSGYKKGGDLIIAVDGIPVKDFGEMFNYIVVKKNPGDVVVFTVIRNGNEIELPLTIEARR